MIPRKGPRHLVSYQVTSKMVRNKQCKLILSNDRRYSFDIVAMVTSIAPERLNDARNKTINSNVPVTLSFALFPTKAWYKLSWCHLRPKMNACYRLVMH